TTSGTGTYYIGEEITLSGTNTDNPNTVYLFLTGPNLPSNGVKLEDPKQEVITSAGVKDFTTADVKADDTWSKKWNTAGLPLDAGSYTIYAVSKDKDKSGLSEAKYATASISLRTGFISATTSSATVAKGDKLIISGTAQGNPDNVFVWIFGKNYYGQPSALFVRDANVESDDSFEVELDSADTDSLAGGQYFVIVQHPMGSKIGSNAGSITYNTVAGTITAPDLPAVTITDLQAPAAATALINALDSPNIPDTYVKLTFVVEEPQLFIDPISTKEAGSKFTITGTTNLAVGGTLVVDVTSAAFQPGEKTEASAFSGTGGSAIIEKGDGMNKWAFEVDATDFKPDQYIVTVESIEARRTATALFDLVEATEKPTTPPAEVTTPPAGEVTTAPPAGETTPTEAAPTPGFGALVALAGLGAVAFLVLRRK
ncbi:MAG: PGF-CTERM sorting domain-containing protein, partial [Methanomicrobiales archaeon]|nr:PGF-CTERM sorting domain-containing protein [Methanomicrobiales archaeon]